MEQYESVFRLIDELFDTEIAFLQQLVRAKSANPYTPDAAPADKPIEAEVAGIIHTKMQQLGWQPALIGPTPQRQNVLCVLEGNDKAGKTLILNTHMDTVPASEAYTRDPWHSEIAEGRLYGLGVADAKAQIAAFIYAVHALQQAGIQLAGTIKFAFVVDEESGACSPYGTRYLLEKGLLDGDAAIIGEPGDDLVSIGHRGLYRFCIRTRGESAHTGLDEWENGTKGHNAVTDMARIIQAFANVTLPDKRSVVFPGRKNVLTFPTLIQGGSGINIVPELCEAYGDTRLLPGISAEDVRRAIERTLQPLGIRYELQEVVYVPAAETMPAAPIVQVLAQAAKDVTGEMPRITGVGPTCDGWMFTTRGIDTICGYGAKCGGVHGADEWADLESLRNVTKTYAQAIMQFLGA